MGLHLNYELRLPAETSRAVVARMLGELRDFAATTRIADVSPLVDLSVNSLESANDAVVGARQCLRFFAEILGDPTPDDEIPRYTGDPSSAIGFRVHPGDRAETATFGLMYRRADVGAEMVE
jgi:hypothetical protein